MKVQRPVPRLATTLALLAACAGAQAAPITLSGYSLGSENIDTSMSNTVTVGQFKGRANLGTGTQDFLTFCTEISQGFNWNTSYDYALVANGSARGFSNSQADLLGRLYTVAGDIDSKTKSVAFQLSVWEILYDTSNRLSLGSGNFLLDSGGSSAVRNQAATWLSGLAGVSSDYQVQRLYSANAQDLIFATHKPRPDSSNQVPEPASWALGLTALAAMALVRRRTRKA
ncbi:hypothetical protein HNP55_001072 [Paucibacter oligotrophus]|uniref:Secreted protein with PEP-CTERM sorting signal n=1 Tax=Roseateles oligotrophus TaxID=1769250 RepID=A0A840LB31_9BURK|nr:PEP-CTERM sorting domain-containing protein [Roseateles oligotrophus]MBB4842557.1 hypothetical protein [Roseateles oligotrophus]